jgi:hypothetical protein
MIATRARFYQPQTPDAEPLTKVCEAEGCAEHGAYRAPKSRNNLRDFRWFCLAHVREYNLSWDYYKDMSQEEIEANLRSDTGWQRPTWPLGRLGHGARMDQNLEDELAFTFGPRTAKAPAPPKLPGELHDALETLGLVWPVALPAVKAKYKKLAKRFHPDANNGDKQSEEMFKAINLAYTTINGKFADFLVRNATSPAV